MSFDLHVFPPSGPRTVGEVRRLLAEEEQRLINQNDSPLPPPEPEMANFLSELERRWPGLEEDPIHSPWSNWPLWQPMLGGGTSLAIRWSRAEEMLAAILEIANSVDVIVYDRQSGEVVTPGLRASTRRNCGNRSLTQTSRAPEEPTRTQGPRQAQDPARTQPPGDEHHARVAVQQASASYCWLRGRGRGCVAGVGDTPCGVVDPAVRGGQDCPVCPACRPRRSLPCSWRRRTG